MEFKSKASVTDVLLTAFSDVFCVIFLVSKIIYGIDVLAFAVLLGISGVCGTWSLLHLPIYIFETGGLRVKESFPLKDGFITYDRIRNFHIKGNFASIITKASHRVDITYRLEGSARYRNIACSLADVYGFVEALKHYSGQLYDHD